MWEATWSQGWEHKAARQVIQMIGAEIVALNTKFPCLQNWVHGTFRKLVRFAAVGIKKAARKTAQETKPEVVRCACQSSALQLPKC